MRIVQNLILLAFGIAVNPVLGQSVKSLDFTIHQEYTSTRALGMGNAFTAVADDHSAIFYNPATLALRKDSQLRMFLRGGTTPETLDLFDEIDKAGQQTDEVNAYSELIKSHYGDHFYFRAPTLGGMWVKKKWGIALIPVDLSLDAAVHRQMGPMLNLNMYMDTALAVSYADKLKWLPKRHTLTWGTTIKSIHRIHVGEAVSAGQLANGSDLFDTERANEGLTIDLDIGTYWKPPVPQRGFFKFLKYMEPSFAIVGRNLIDYGFKQNFHFIDKNSGEPPHLQRRFDFGSRWDLPKFWVFDPKLAADIRDVGHDNFTLRKGTHVGLEFYWKLYSWWKGHWSVGLNQEYWTAGFGARFGFFQLDLATFGEEVGTDSVKVESRRYIAEMSLDF